MRTFNFALVLITALICLGTYRVAEEARVARAELRLTERRIKHEHQALLVLDAEWAALTQPQRIAALAQRHLDLNDQPTMQLSSLTLLPRRGEGPPTEAPIRSARAIVPLPAAPMPAPLQQANRDPNIRHVAMRTGA